MSNWIFLQTKCYSFSVNFSVSSHLQKKQITYEKNCITLLIYSIYLWKNDSLNVMDSKFIGVTWQNMGVQCIYLIYEIGCNPTQKKTSVHMQLTSWSLKSVITRITAWEHLQGFFFVYMYRTYFYYVEFTCNACV